MSRAAVMRAGGAYAEETSRYLGVLMLKASVLAGLRVRDQNKYAPDPRLIPKDPRKLYRNLRKVLLECRDWVQDMIDYIENKDQVGFSSTDFLQIPSLNSALQLSRLAVEARENDPLARITLASNWFRKGSYAEALEHLSGVLKQLSCHPNLKARTFRNIAGVVACLGDLNTAARFAEIAFWERPSDPLNQHNFLIYAETIGTLDRAMRMITKYFVGVKTMNSIVNSKQTKRGGGFRMTWHDNMLAVQVYPPAFHQENYAEAFNTIQ